MDIKVVDVPVEEKIEAKEPDTVVSTTGQLLVQSVAEMFDLKPSESSKFQSKINTLIDYAKTQTDQHSPEGIKWALRSLALKVGTPPLGEKLITYLTKYAYLATEKKNLEKEIEKYERNDS